MIINVLTLETGAPAGRIEVSDDGARVDVLEGDEAFRQAMGRLSEGFQTTFGWCENDVWFVRNIPAPPSHTFFRHTVGGVLECLGYVPAWGAEE